MSVALYRSPHLNLLQAKKDASSFRVLVLIGVAVACCAASFLPRMTKSSVASKLAEANHPVACLPQWVPVLLAANTVSSQERLVYNRIGKAGSSFMISTLAALSKTNHFTLENHANFWPSKAVLAQELGRSLRSDTVYVNHANFLNGTASDLKWINVVREPIARWSSLFYYDVDVSLRGEKAVHALALRAKDTQCGCAGLEFYECIRVRCSHKCTLNIPSQISSFCERDERCSRVLATARLHASYLLVGLTEELEMTLKVMEKMLPRFFRGATNMSTKGSPRATALTNQLTHTSLTGAIPDETRKLIQAHAVNYMDEHLFYEDTKRLFWHRACEHSVI